VTERPIWEERHRRANGSAGPSAFVAEQARTFARLRPGGRALDLACGPGRHARLLSDLGFQTFALDFAWEALVRAAPAGGRVLGVLADAGRLPFREASFDLVVQTCFLDRAILPALAEVLTQGGRLIAETFGTAQFEATGHPRREYCLEPGELEQLCESPRVGLVVEASSHGDVGDADSPRHLLAVAARRP
jgi:SAM-dependent methyltransferase